MSGKINSASRLVGLLEKTLDCPEGDETLIVWCKVLDISNTQNKLRCVHEVTQAVNLMYMELAVIKAAMISTDISSNLYHPHIERIEAALSMEALNSQWVHRKQYLKADTVLALKWCIEILPDEESLILSEELKKLAESVEELLTAISTSTLPEHLKALMRRHASLVKSAIVHYPITGAKALQAALSQGLGDMFMAADELKKADTGSAEVISKWKQVWMVVGKATDGVVKTDKFITSATKLIENGIKILENFNP